MRKSILKGIFLLALSGCIISCAVLLTLIVRYEKDEKSYKILREQVSLAGNNERSDVSASKDFNKLLRINPDTVGWISDDAGSLDYPIVQGSDNSFYLKHLFSKQIGSSGCIFLDSRNSPDFSDANSIVYGHNMRIGTMFGSLDKYRSRQYFEQHPTLMLYTPKKAIALQVFAGVTTSSKNVVYRMPLNSKTEMLSYAEWAQKHSHFASNMNISSQDHLVTFVTCAYDFTDARFILIAKY